MFIECFRVESANGLRLPAVCFAPGQQLHCDRKGRYEEDYRAQYPHEGSGGGLICKRAEAEHSRLFAIAWIGETSREDQKRGYSGVDYVSAKQIWEQHPTRSLESAGPWFDYGPPEKHAGEKEAGVFEVVDVLVGERGLIRCGNMPADVGEVHEEPCGFWLDKSMEKFAQPPKTNQWTEDRADKPERKSTQHRHNRRSEDDERRRDGHEHEMLRHVDNEKPVAECVEG